MSSLILTTAQAEAVYGAMCALNNIDARLDARVGPTRVYETLSGTVVVSAYALPTEDYANQAAFAAAYNLE